MIGVIVQARMGSSRLPGKVLMPIAGRPLLGHVLGRLKDGLCQEVQIVVATSALPENNVISAYCYDHNISCFHGSEDDVLSRYYECASINNFEHVVRLTADNPFTDVEELDRLIEFHLSNSFDYSHSFNSLPIGVGAEIFSFAALEKSYKEGSAEHHREHVNEYILENQDSFSIGRLDVPATKVNPNVRLTVDTEEDYSRACMIAEQVSRYSWLQTEEVIDLCLQSA